uniref:Uncharacterized protein n=1 Tax=Anguilla anguilla TaxID=7936 RepID=A0A0E9QEN9_ANGAN
MCVLTFFFGGFPLYLTSVVFSPLSYLESFEKPPCIISSLEIQQNPVKLPRHKILFSFL